MTTLRNNKPNVETNVISNVNPGRLIVPKFQQFYQPSGIGSLNHLLEINSVLKEPTLRYKLGDADGTDLDPWLYGEVLDLQAGTVPTYNNGSPGLGAYDDSAKFNAGGYYLADNNTFGNVSTKDIAAALFFEATGTTSVLMAKRNAGVGWEIGIDASDRLYLTIEDAGGATTTVSAALTSGRFYYAEIYADRSGSCQIYINTAASGAAVDISSRNGTLDSATALAIGGDSAGNGLYDKRIAYVALWDGAAWLDTHLQTTIAKKRAAQVFGYWPYIAAGTKQPTTFTRAFGAYVDKVESGYIKYYYVDSEHLRMSHRIDKNGVNVRGYLPETQATNLIPESEDFSTWDLIEAGTVVVDDAEVCPDGRTKMASIAGDSDDEQHGIADDITLTAVTHAFSGFYKPGSDVTHGKDWVYVNNSTVANCDCYFDCANGTVGTAGAGCKGYIEGPFLNGSYRWCIVFTGTVAAHTLQVSPAVADGDNDFVGDGSTVNGYVWGCQVEAGDYMTSPIRTDGGTATRLKDNLQFTAGANIGGEDVGKGSIYADVLFSDYDVTGTAKSILALSDEASADDRLLLAVSATNDKFYCLTRATAGNNGDAESTGDVADNAKHAVAALYETDNLLTMLDGVEGTADTTADMPDDLDEMVIGANRGAANQANGLIQNLRIYDEIVNPEDL